ncbi:GNAT family N-acetyltransferase [Streptomyces sp. NPDC041068]|uniref:GNAT family N-acetyltransferase n=1 Tax=Streptomyces sp. NPDC041068 TaxID=3155130 RepID=UPI0033F9D6A1
MLTVIAHRDGAGLLAAAGDPWTAGLITPDWSGTAWSVPGAAAYGTAPGPEPTEWITAVGAPDRAAALLHAVLPGLPSRPYGLTVPRGTALDGIDGVIPEDEAPYEHWELMTTAQAPASHPSEERVRMGDDASHAELSALLTEASPGYAVRPGDPQVEVWATIRTPEGALAAVGALQRRPGTGVAHLASIAAAPALRGQGLGAAVTGRLTRYVLEKGEAFCTLSVHSGNDAALRLYRRLGYRTAQEFTSVELDDF